MHVISWALLAFSEPALGAEVVWLSAPSDPQAAERAASLAGATGTALTPVELRTAATAWGPADDEAFSNLERALREVRPYETRLDGELAIMTDLAGPIANIDVLRDAGDAGALFSALAYQGFAVDRFFAEDLANDDRAAPFRLELNATVVEVPWADAVALDPDRQLTPYDIAEAPQRVAYAAVQELVRKALPARIAPVDLPTGARLFVDGRETTATATGTVALVPGRHLVHVERDGRIFARYDLRLTAGQRIDVAVPLSDAAWETWLAAVASGTATDVPAGLAPAILALGGEVWIVDGVPSGSGSYGAWKVTTTAVERFEIAPPITEDAATKGGWSFVTGLGGGWLSSGDFYTQDPSSPRTVATVNALTLGVSLRLDRDIGWLRLGVGVDTLVTLGEYHEAYTGNARTRFRPYPHLAVGLRPIQVTFGYLFPYHRAAGLRASVPLAGSLELLGSFACGLPSHRVRSDGSTWDALPVLTGWGGLSWRL
jgi:hypothetical protein